MDLQPTYIRPGVSYVKSGLTGDKRDDSIALKEKSYLWVHDLNVLPGEFRLPQ